MVKPTISGTDLLLEVEGADKFFALKSSLSIPLRHITGARLDNEIAKGWWHGLRLPGSNIPGVITVSVPWVCFA